MNDKWKQLIDLIVNEEEEKANELFHEIVIESSRGIYENLIASESESQVDEAEVEEDNAFNTAAAKAAMAGEKHFTFNGKKYPVKMSKADAEKLLDDVNEMEHPDHEEADAEEIADAIKWRITASPITLDKILKHTDMRSLLDAIEQEAEFHAPMDEIGSSDISAMVNGVMRSLGIKEANEEGTPDIVEQAVQAYKGKKDNMSVSYTHLRAHETN